MREPGLFFCEEQYGLPGIDIVFCEELVQVAPVDSRLSGAFGDVTLCFFDEASKVGLFNLFNIFLLGRF